MARGRPRIKIDYRQVEQLAAMQCTDEEIAAVLGVERSTIKRRKKADIEADWYTVRNHQAVAFGRATHGG